MADYEDKTWENFPEGGTPLSADGLNDWESRVKTAVDSKVDLPADPSPGDAIGFDADGNIASLSVVSRVPEAATINTRDGRGNITKITEGGVETTYTWWLGDGSIADDSVKTEATLGKTKTFTYTAGVLTGWTVA